MKASSSGGKGSSSVSITVPTRVKKGLLVCVSTGWTSYLTQNTPSGEGIKTISSNYNKQVNGICSCIVRVYECEFNAGKTITLSYSNGSQDASYPTAQLILIA